MAVSYESLTNAAGAPSKKSGAPGELDCTDCHSGTAISSGKKWSNISLTTNTGSTLDYIPDSTYTITLDYTESAKTKFGFELTPLRKSDNKLAGTLKATANTTKVVTGTVNGNSRDYMTQTSNGNTFSNNNAKWSFEWKAPSSNVGDIIFYVALNVTNADKTDNGDEVYIKQFTFSPSSKLPVASISSKKNTLCLGDTLSLQGSSTNNATDWAWSVSPAGSGSGLTTTSQDCKFTFTAAGNYNIFLRSKNDKGYSLFDTAKVTVLDRPSATAVANGSTQLCPGSSVKIDLNGSYANCSLLWNNGKTDSTITVSQAGDYFCVITNKNGCSTTTNTVTVTSLIQPQSSISGATNGDQFCSNALPTITGPAGASAYNWTINGTSAGNNQQLNLQGQSGNISIALTVDSGGCTSATSTLSISLVNPLAKPAVTYSSTQNSASLSWTAVSGATGYEVSEDGGTTWITPSSGATGLTHDVSGLQANQTYTFAVRATGTAPCGNGPAETLQVVTSNCSSIPYTVTSDSAVCAGQGASFSISVGISRYQLSVNGTNVGNQTQFNITNLQADTTIQLALLDSNALVCPATTGNVTIRVNALPVVKFSAIPTANSLDITCLDQTTGASSWAWDFGDGTTSNQQNPAHTYATKGTYTVTLTVTDGKGCSAVKTTQVTVTGKQQTTGISELTTSSFMGYPNPVNDELTLRGLPQQGVIRVMDISGRILLETKNETGDMLLNTTAWKPGTYWVVWQGSNQRQSIMLVKE